ncbi:MAG TPA: Hpt domain-containing protein [Oligoflexia bacterium]|nr:Hpt domain-containing protein [Oligoflexia bacterium]
MSESSYIDRSALVQFDDLDQEGLPPVLPRLIALFLKNAPKRIAEFTKHAKTLSIKGLKWEAHALKSSSQTLGARKLAEACLKIESLADKADSKKIRRLVTNLKKTYVLSCRELMEIKVERSKRENSSEYTDLRTVA